MVHESGAGRTRVLVVDDHRLSRQFTVAALRQTGCSVKQARDVHEAVRTGREWLPAVVLVDWHLGDGNGAEMVRRLRDHWPNGHELPRLVLLTGESPERLPPGLADCGFVQILTKPFEAADLLRAAQVPAQRYSVNEAGEPFDLRLAFATELQHRFPELERSIADGETVLAAATVHQLIAGSALSGERELESELRALNEAVLNDPRPGVLADAWCRLSRSAEKFLYEAMPGS